MVLVVLSFILTIERNMSTENFRESSTYELSHFFNAYESVVWFSQRNRKCFDLTSLRTNPKCVMESREDFVVEQETVK